MGLIDFVTSCFLKNNPEQKYYKVITPLFYGLSGSKITYGKCCLVNVSAWACILAMPPDGFAVAASDSAIYYAPRYARLVSSKEYFEKTFVGVELH